MPTCQRLRRLLLLVCTPSSFRSSTNRCSRGVHEMSRRKYSSLQLVPFGCFTPRRHGRTMMQQVPKRYTSLFAQYGRLRSFLDYLLASWIVLVAGLGVIFFFLLIHHPCRFDELPFPSRRHQRTHPRTPLQLTVTAPFHYCTAHLVHGPRSGDVGVVVLLQF